MPKPNNSWVISVVFETRSDGGLRVYSDDVPGFMLSHADTSAVYKDVMPALETILGEMVHSRVKIEPVDFAMLLEKPVKQYLKSAPPMPHLLRVRNLYAQMRTKQKAQP